jgi:hypothetical protein
LESRTEILSEPGVTISDAGTVAVICVALTNWLLSGEPFANTVDPASKFAPFTVRLDVAPPAWRNVGLSVVTLNPASTGSETAFEVRWFESRTEILNEPGVAISEAGTVAVICVALTNWLLSGEPFANTVDPASKFAPFTVRLDVAPPAWRNVGLSVVTLNPASTGSETAFEVRWLASRTVMLNEPALAIREAGTVAVISVALPKAEVKAVVPANTVMPFAKPDPLTVRLRFVPPACANVGFNDEITIGASTCRSTALETRWLESRTEIATVPALATNPAGIVAVICVALWKVLLTALPFARTVDPLSKPLPVTCSVNCPDPAWTDAGLSEVTFTAPSTLKFSEFEMRVPSVKVTGTTFCVAINAAGTFAVTLVAVLPVVVSGFPLNTICAPLRTAVAFTVSGNCAPPAVANDGFREVML